MRPPKVSIEKTETGTTESRVATAQSVQESVQANITDHSKEIVQSKTEKSELQSVTQTVSNTGSSSSEQSVMKQSSSSVVQQSSSSISSSSSMVSSSASSAVSQLSSSAIQQSKMVASLSSSLEATKLMASSVRIRSTEEEITEEIEF
jgi:hypothetical protein